MRTATESERDEWVDETFNFAYQIVDFYELSYVKKKKRCGVTVYLYPCVCASVEVDAAR